jgi:NADPH:quinone reductase-like Zn-dependent oxidoreductase
VVAFGASTPEPTTFDVSGFYTRSGAKLYGMRVFDELAMGRSAAHDLGLLVSELAAGRLDPQIALTASWRDPDAALAALMDRRVAGKAVLQID